MGQKRLQSAIAAFDLQKQAKHNVAVEWKPYIIDPNIKVDGEDFESYNIRRWGSSSWTNHLKQEGRKSGANFANWKWWPNTIKAHCLIKFAKERYGVDTSRSNEVIFQRLYEQGENISLVDCLVDIGVQSLNLPDGDELRRFLESGEGEADVRAEMKLGQKQYRISGVPFFIIAAEKRNNHATRPYGLSGAQRTETFLEVFEEVLKEEEE